MTDPQTVAEDAARQFLDADTAAWALGITVGSVAPGAVTAHMTVGPEMRAATAAHTAPRCSRSPTSRSRGPATRRATRAKANGAEASSARQKNEPRFAIGFASCRATTNAVTTPKSAPAPRSAHTRSGWGSSEAVTVRPSAGTSVAATRLSQLSPCWDVSHPMPRSA